MSEQSVALKTEDTPPQMVAMQLMTGYWISQMVYVAARLGLADLLADGPKTSEQLARASGTHAETLNRLLRALVSVGMFSTDADGRYTLTPISELFRSGPGSMSPMIIHTLETPSWQAWGALLESVKTGQTGFPLVHGQEVFPYYATHPESAEPFNEAMTGYSAMVSSVVVQAYDFSSFKKIVDVGGGHGGMLIEILKANHGATGVVFDQPDVATGAKTMIKAESLESRCEAVGGDFFVSVPAGGDAYLMKFIIHDWDDERSVTILKNIHRAMADNGKLLLVEAVVPPGNEPHFSKFMDIHMLIMTGGRERTEAEYAALFARAGFKLTRIVPTQSTMSVIEAVKA